MASYPNCSSDWTLVSVTASGKTPLLCVSSSLDKRERESVWEVQAQTHCPVRYLVPKQLQGASRWGGEGANLSRILGELSSSSCFPCPLHLALKPGWIVGLENVYHAVYCSSAELTCMFAPSHKTKSLPLKEDEAAEADVAAALHQPEAPVLLQLSWAGTCVGQSVSEKWVKFFLRLSWRESFSFLRLEKRRENPEMRIYEILFKIHTQHESKKKKRERDSLVPLQSAWAKPRADKNVDTRVGLALNYDPALFGFWCFWVLIQSGSSFCIDCCVGGRLQAMVKQSASIFSHDLGGKGKKSFISWCDRADNLLFWSGL